MANETHRPGQGPAGNQSGNQAGSQQQWLEQETEAARQSAQRVGEEAQRQIKEVTSDLQGQAQRVLSEQKEMARSGLMDLVTAIRTAADDLERRQQGQIANVARGLAGGLEDFSQSIGRRNFQDMLSDAQRFARDHPAAFFGGAVLAGLAVARFAKSSSGHQHQSRFDQQSERQSETTSPYAARRSGQGGQLAEFARHEREHGAGPETGSITR